MCVCLLFFVLPLCLQAQTDTLFFLDLKLGAQNTGTIPLALLLDDCGSWGLSAPIIM